jgi:hypothetical protein
MAAALSLAARVAQLRLDLSGVAENHRQRCNLAISFVS